MARRRNDEQDDAPEGEYGMIETIPLEIDLPQFHGPLDLLLHLIQKNEMDIHEIRIAEIADQYLAFLNLMQSLDLDVASEYLVMASTLLYLKSQSMLPSARPLRDGGFDPREVRERLVRQLLEYKRFKQAARCLGDAQAARGERFTRPADDAYASTASREYHIQATLFDLLSAFQRVLRRVEETPPDFPDAIEEEPITVEQKIGEILADLQRNGRMEFGTFFTRFQSKLEVVCTFLAILELTRMRQTFAFQEEPYGPILIELNPDRPDIAAFRWTTYDDERPDERSMEADY